MQWGKNIPVYSLVRQRRKVERFGTETTSSGRLFHKEIHGVWQKRKITDIIRWAERNVPPRVEPHGGNEMNRALGHLCAHYRLNWARRTS